MKLSIHIRRNKASTLVAALLTTTVLMISLVGYLDLVSYHVLNATRSECWNMAITVAEAGIEEAIAHLTQNGLTNLISNGWSTSDTNAVTKTRYLDNNYFSVTIISNRPVSIVSTGAVWVPGNASTNYVKRQVSVTAQPKGQMFPCALVLLQSMTMNGNAFIDSFDSANGPWSADTRRANANVACLGRIAQCVNVGNGNVYGKIFTTSSGSVYLNNGSIGDVAWVGANHNTHNGLEPGWVTNNLQNISMPNAPIAAFSGSTPVGGSYGGVSYKYALGTGNYELLDLTLKGNDGMLVKGDARLHVYSSISVAGSAYIKVLANASLTIFMDGQETVIIGGGIVNDSQIASKVRYYGGTNNTSITIGGNANYYGAYYAPQADIKIFGTGDLTGAFVGKTVDNLGTSNIHFDEQLSNLIVEGNAQWNITSWAEQ